MPKWVILGGCIALIWYHYGILEAASLVILELLVIFLNSIRKYHRENP